MNKTRLKQLSELLPQLVKLHDELVCIASDEQDAFDSLPESFQTSDKGSSIQDNAESLHEASDSLQQAIDIISDFELPSAIKKTVSKSKKPVKKSGKTETKPILNTETLTKTIHIKL